MSNSHIKFGQILSNGLGGDSITDGRMDGLRRLQQPLTFFLKKSVGITNLRYCSIMAGYINTSIALSNSKPIWDLYFLCKHFQVAVVLSSDLNDPISIPRCFW